MSLIFLAIASVILTAIALSIHFYGMHNDGCKTTVMLLTFAIIIVAFIPVYSYDDNASICDTPVYKTEIGYVANHNGIMYTITEYEIVNSTTIDDIKIVDVKGKCGLGWYKSSNIYIANLKDEKWSALTSPEIN